MLAFILFILKIIGILLAVILFLIALVLFVPIRYRIEGSYYQELKGKVKISWLLSVVSFFVEYDKELDSGVKVFGIRLGRKNQDEEVDGDEALNQPKDEDVKESAVLQTPSVHTQEEAEPEPPEPEPPEPEPEPPTPEPKRAEAKAEKKKAKKPRESKKNRVTFQGICDKLKLWKNKLENLWDVIHKEENIKTFQLVKGQLFSLIKHVFPRKIKGRIHFGFDDPYHTGQVLTYISPFYGCYGKSFAVIPDFQEKVLEGEVTARGRVRIAKLVFIGIQLFRDRNLRRLLKKWRES